MGDKKRAKDTLSALGTANKLPDDLASVCFVHSMQQKTGSDSVFNVSPNCLFVELFVF